jgi:uncharacterized protein (TIGR02271 family)
MAIKTAASVQEPEHEGALVVPVAQEELRVGTRRVDTGRGVRIRKTVSEHTRQLDQVLLGESVEVRRVPVDRVVALADAPSTRQEGDTLIVPVLEEILVVEKRVRIKEELHIIRSTHQHAWTGSVNLRTEQVAVERFDDSPAPK